MAPHTLTLDDELIRRARQQDPFEASKSDDQVIADAITVYLGDRALSAVRALGTLDEDEANRLAVEELHAMRREHRATAWFPQSLTRMLSRPSTVTCSN